jgi:hypothetical protein
MIEYSGMIHIGWKQNKTVTNISIKKNIMQNIISIVKYVSGKLHVHTKV